MTMWRNKSGQHGDESGNKKEAAILPRDATTATPVPDPAEPLGSQTPAVLLAMCLFGEARGESEAALRAVAQVVLNRARHPHPVFGSRSGMTWEENLRRVILRPGQFSCFHPSDPNYAKLLRPQEAEDAAVWERCLRCAEQALTIWNQHDTITSSSDHYFDDSIQPPSWADPAKRTVKFGRLNFYRLYLRAPASSPAQSAVSIPSQEPPQQEPSAGRPSPANGLASASAALQPQAGRSEVTENEVLHPHEPPSPGPAFCLGRNDTLSVVSAANAQRRPRPGRLSSLLGSIRGKGSTGGRGGKGNTDMSSLRCLNPLLPLHRLLRLPPAHYSLLPALLALCLLATGCNEFERAAYRTLAVTQAEYETVQRHVAEAAAHGLITEEQWNRFAVAGHRFIDAHNAAVDAFELWSRVKNSANEARVLALLEILPRLVRELSSLANRFEEDRESGVRSQKSEAEETPKPKLQNPNKLQTPNSKQLHLWNLGFGICSLLGVWNLEFGVWCLKEQPWH